MLGDIMIYIIIELVTPNLQGLKNTTVALIDEKNDVCLLPSLFVVLVNVYFVQIVACIRNK